MNPFERSSGLQTSFRIQSLTFWHCTRYRRFKFKTGPLNISDQHLLKIKNEGVHNVSRMSLSVGLIGVQETAKFGGSLRSVDFCYHKFKNVFKTSKRPCKH